MGLRRNDARREPGLAESLFSDRLGDPRTRVHPGYVRHSDASGEACRAGHLLILLRCEQLTGHGPKRDAAVGIVYSFHSATIS